MRRVAVCFFGQPRTYKFCSKILKRVFEQERVQVDYFIHTWNRNTYGTGWGDEEEVVDEKVLEKELQQIYSPKKVVVEDNKYLGEIEEDDYMFDVLGMLYSMCRSIHYKREFEKREDFRYDLVIVCRLDLGFRGDSILFTPEEIYLQNLCPPKVLLGLSTPNPILGECPESGFQTQIDLIFAMSSETSDTFAGAYRWAFAVGGSWGCSPSFRQQESGYRTFGHFRTMGPDIVLYRFCSAEGLVVSPYSSLGNFFPIRMGVLGEDLENLDEHQIELVLEYYDGFKPEKGIDWDRENLRKYIKETV